jgi:D-sedoheptulose 7-phosphate isomerase
MLSFDSTARHAACSAIAADARALAAAGSSLASAFERGARLFALGDASDARHAAVEFMHPVLAGKRALPAFALTGGDAVTKLRRDARPGDVALGLGPEALVPLRTAAELDLVTVALVDRPEPSVAHVFTSDARFAREVRVTRHHLLWELTHAFLEARSALPPLAGGAVDPTESLEASTRAKALESAELRRATLAAHEPALMACAAELRARLSAGATLFTFGNGGSATDAQAIAEDFGSLGRAVCLSDDAAIVTALANDVSFEIVFARQLLAIGKRGDVALALSTSGSSPNVLAALERARRAGLVTIGLSGSGGGRMAELSLDHHLAVPSSSVHRIQEAHTTLAAALVEAARSRA